MQINRPLPQAVLTSVYWYGGATAGFTMVFGVTFGGGGTSFSTGGEAFGAGDSRGWLVF
jgi:hypothetical protein